MPFDNTTYLEPAADPEVVDQPDPYDLDTFIAWLETMPGDEYYDYDACDGGCLIGQYAAAMNVPDQWKKLHWDENMDRTALGQIAGTGVHTYGAALERAKAARS